MFQQFFTPSTNMKRGFIDQTRFIVKCWTIRKQVNRIYVVERWDVLDGEVVK